MAGHKRRLFVKLSVISPVFIADPVGSVLTNHSQLIVLLLVIGPVLMLISRKERSRRRQRSISS